jgi:hypothetical protein
MFPSSLWQLSPLFHRDDQIFIFPALLRRLGIGSSAARCSYVEAASGGTGDTVFGAEDVIFPHYLLVFHGQVSVTTCDWVKHDPGSGGIPSFDDITAYSCRPWLWT